MIFSNDIIAALSPLKAPNFLANHGFFTRKGGVSTGFYASLNCSFSSADPLQNTLINRQRVAQAFNLPLPCLQSVRQIHSNKVITLSADSISNKSFSESENEFFFPPLGEADALVSDQKGLILSIVTADCAPVLFYEPIRKIIAAAHAGRKGAFAGILEATLTEIKMLGGDPSECFCVIGPCIQQKSYEVPKNIRFTALECFPWAKTFFIPSGKTKHFLFDLPGFCKKLLENQNVKEVITLDYDTFSQPELFFSYRRKMLRREPATGHQISAITL